MSELLHLEHDLGAPARARRWLLEACRAWGCMDLAQDAALLVDELTTNVVLHACTDCLVEADFDGVALWASVGDEKPGDVRLEPSTIQAERGRGLMIVDALENAWGVSPTPTGKSVWFALWSPSLTGAPVRMGRQRRWHPSKVPGNRAPIA